MRGAAEHLHLMLAAVDRGELEAGPGVRARLEGAVAALEIVSGGEEGLSVGKAQQALTQTGGCVKL
jgi:hypothetical protein